MSGAVLFDTNVVSELVRPKPDPRVVRFVRSQQDPWLSVLTLHELVYGAERVEVARARAKLLGWIASVEVEFAGRIVPIDGAVALRAGRMRALAASQGRTCHAVDSLIAASALAVGAVLVTRNVRDFEHLGVSLVDPWDASPA